MNLHWFDLLNSRSPPANSNVVGLNMYLMSLSVFYTLFLELLL